MSGPKVSVYSLTGAARIIVEGQIRCEQDALFCASKIQEMLSSLDAAKIGLGNSIATLKKLDREFGSGGNLIEEIQSFQATLAEKVQQLKREYARSKPVISSKYTITEEALENKKKMLFQIQKVKAQVQRLKDEADQYIAAGKATGEKEQRRRQDIIVNYLSVNGLQSETETEKETIVDSIELRQNISSGIAMAVSFDNMDESAKRDEVTEKKSELKKRLVELLQEELPKEIKDKIQENILRLEKISSKTQLQSFNAVAVSHVMKQIEKHFETVSKQRQEYEDLLARYQALCQMAGIESKRFTFSMDAIQKMSDEIEQMEKVLIKQTEQDYIRDTVNEVMADMGYDIIGHRDVTKRSGKRFHNELYRFNEGTAVNITFSPEGQISMELGGIARQDRLPDSEETEVLTRDMETFCGEFAAFERKLREKGIVVGSRIALAPPSQEYATIINVSDYEIADETKASDLNVRKKQRFSKKTVHRRDD